MAFPPCHSFMFQTHEDPDLHLSAAAASSSFNNLPSCLPQHFHGGGGGGGVPFMMKRSLSFSGVDDKCSHHHYDHHQDLHGGGGGDQDDLSDDGSQLLIGEKKKRLNLEQVKTLEKSFEMGNKLEPERKLQLAKALGLQPRQVAIWFQNRRARWKTKQLEKYYDVLKKKFDALKAENDALQSHNKKLQAELLAVKGGSKDSNFEGGLSNNNNNLKKETIDQGSWSNGSTDDNSSDHVNLDMSRSTTPAANSPPSNSQIITNGSKNLFRSSLCRPPHGSITHLLQGSSRGVDQMIQDDQAFCTMFNNGSIDQDHQGGFWPWPPATEQPHHFH